MPHHRHGYVQWMFIDTRARLLCEASSGFYFGTERTFWLAKDKVDALERLGFFTDDSNGNFQYFADIGTRPDFNTIADLILGALHDSYGARANSRLTFNAPFAPSESSSCKPVS